MSKKQESTTEGRKPIFPLLDLDRETEEQLCTSIAHFQGVGTTLESALGALVMGQHFGFRALRMLHNPSTYRKYEEILGIKFHEHCPDETTLSTKMTGMRIAHQLGKFWDIVMGREKVDGKGVLDNEPE